MSAQEPAPANAPTSGEAADPMRWVWRGLVAITLLFGWVFILIKNKFHLDTPVVVVMLAYLAVVATVANLWRVGAATVAPKRPGDAWARPLGARGDLEKEKKSLLRSIKEAEFDQLMGKLTKLDADALIQMYRARAIEVIKELDRLDVGDAETPRKAIQREVAARLAIEETIAKKSEKVEKAVKKAAKKSTEAKSEAS